MKRFFFLIILLIIPVILFSQDSLKTYTTVRITDNIKIDGVLDEPSWQMAPAMNDFFQWLPNEGTMPDHPMEVRITYDDNAIYIGATSYDSAPDSILKELGVRDASEINADYVRVGIDPYNNRQDAYFFGVSASGVQFDSKVSDPTYDAVWESQVKITDKGWVAEIKIPYSAIRFPKKPEQQWAFQVNRSVRRTREFTQWAKTPSKTNNSQIYWGTLKGVNYVSAPLRLSLTPYLSTYIESTPFKNAEGKTEYSNSFSYNVGADLKYGIDERFTLDMTLFPDFGQVQSDAKVKNLSYREVVYDENRSFFKESVELFDKNRLFYSRRIGKIPSGFYSLETKLNPGETVEENPYQTKLLNAIKLSGRTDDGLGIGIFNAITDNVHAKVKDSTGAERKILTEPLTNFNALVFDQQMKNNSSLYFINTNVTRDKGFSDANVTGSGFTLSNKKNTFAFEGAGALSQQINKMDDTPAGEFNTTFGYFYGLGLKKLGGTFEYGISRGVYDNNYYTSDLGFQVINNKIVYETFINHNLHQPWKIFRNSYNNLYYTYATHYQTGKSVINEINVNLFATFLDYNSIFGGGGCTPGESYDYFEPRVEGRFNKSIQYYYSFIGFSSDYRKKVALDIDFNLSNFIGQFVSEGYTLNAKVRYRINDKLTVKLISSYGYDPYNLGWVDITPDDEIIYGLRYLHTYTNELNAVYTFKNDMFLSVNIRHYWNTAEYRKYLSLLDNGDFKDNYEYAVNNDFNYNAFNIDLVYSWQFAPGSNLSIVYKNAIENDVTGIVKIPSYDDNFKKMVHDPQINNLSLKVLYFLDYQYVKKRLTGR